MSCKALKLINQNFESTLGSLWEATAAHRVVVLHRDNGIGPWRLVLLHFGPTETSRWFSRTAPCKPDCPTGRWSRYVIKVGSLLGAGLIRSENSQKKHTENCQGESTVYTVQIIERYLLISPPWEIFRKYQQVDGERDNPAIFTSILVVLSQQAMEYSECSGRSLKMIVPVLLIRNIPKM